MSKEKQIEEMAKIFCGMKNGCDGCMWVKAHCNERSYAEEIYNAGYRKQSEWISVEERLPETSDKVLVYCSNGQIYPAKCIRVPGLEFWFEETCDHCCHSITHWMPLPEAPKMKGGEE